MVLLPSFQHVTLTAMVLLGPVAERKGIQRSLQGFQVDVFERDSVCPGSGQAVLKLGCCLPGLSIHA